MLLTTTYVLTEISHLAFSQYLCEFSDQTNLGDSLVHQDVELAKHQVIKITRVGLMNNNSTNQLRSLRTLSRKSGRYQGDINPINLQQKSKEGWVLTSLVNRCVCVCVPSKDSTPHSFGGGG